MEALREITVWPDNTKNGIYLMSGDKCYAFCSYTGQTTYFTKPLQIEKKGRKFEKVQNLFAMPAAEKDTNVVEVKGSKGDTYYVNVAEKTCSCSGFKFRGRCKHLEQAVS